jgi:transcriptional regulator with XRE-family HTH domain
MADKDVEAEIRATLSKNIKRFRAKQDLSQLELAINAGLAPNFVNSIENGKKWISPRTLAKLSRVLKMKPHEFFIPETTIPEEVAAALAGYLDDMTDDFVRWVKEAKGHYLPNPPNDEED